MLSVFGINGRAQSRVSRPSRRSFLAGLGSLVGGLLLDQAVPLGRVWSFPKHIVCKNVAPYQAKISDFTAVAKIYYEPFIDRAYLNRGVEWAPIDWNNADDVQAAKAANIVSRTLYVKTRSLA